MNNKSEEEEGEITTIAIATSKSKSLRTTIPIGIVRQFRLREKDKLNWQINVINGKMVIIVEPAEDKEAKKWLS